MFLVFCEVGSQSGAFTGKGISGGFVTVVVVCEDVSQAIERAKLALIEDKYEIVNIDKVMVFEELDWELQSEIQTLVKKSKKDGKIRYSQFNVWNYGDSAPD